MNFQQSSLGDHSGAFQGLLRVGGRLENFSIPLRVLIEVLEISKAMTSSNCLSCADKVDWAKFNLVVALVTPPSVAIV